MIFKVSKDLWIADIVFNITVTSEELKYRALLDSDINDAVFATLERDNLLPLGPLALGTPERIDDDNWRIVASMPIINTSTWLLIKYAEKLD